MKHTEKWITEEKKILTKIWSKFVILDALIWSISIQFNLIELNLLQFNLIKYKLLKTSFLQNFQGVSCRAIDYFANDVCFIDST